LEVALNMLTNLWKNFTELEDTLKLRLISNRTVLWVIPVLFPSLRITSSCLNVSMRARADPHFSPGGRYNGLSDPINYFEIGDALPKLVKIEEPFTCASPPNAG
jgi:hypothetical protein